MKPQLHILLVNDDGFHADGLQTLYLHLKKVAKVTIVAPDRERSAVGHGITMYRPLRVSRFSIDHTLHWLVDGTPSDCVKLAVENLLADQRPDLIISGINRGPNLGNDVLYSGTVSAAIEGSLSGIPSIATSLTGYGKLDFEAAAIFIAQNVLGLKIYAEQAVLNINFPLVNKVSEFKGIKLTRLGNRIYQNVFEERQDPRGQTYFWMGGEPKDFMQTPDSDIRAVDDGYISITPLNSDLTDEKMLEKIACGPINI